MSYQIEASIEVAVIWDDAAQEWTIAPEDQAGHLGWVKAPVIQDGGGGVRPYSILERAQEHPVTVEDLTHMLGFAMVRATAPANADVDWRPASPSLVGMLKDVLSIPDHGMSDEVRGTLIRRLLPIFSSVDENAHRRGMFDQRQAALTEGQS